MLLLLESLSMSEEVMFKLMAAPISDPIGSVNALRS
jgi:hypothetical protein